MMNQSKALTQVQTGLYGYLAWSRGKYITEMFRELEGQLSRRTIANGLIGLEKRALLKSLLV
jgi:hypothetical protein